MSHHGTAIRRSFFQMSWKYHVRWPRPRSGSADSLQDAMPTLISNWDPNLKREINIKKNRIHDQPLNCSQLCFPLYCSLPLSRPGLNCACSSLEDGGQHDTTGQLSLRIRHVSHLQWPHLPHLFRPFLVGTFPRPFACEASLLMSK